MTHAAVEILNDDALPLWKSCKLLHHDDTLTLVGYTNYDTRDFYRGILTTHDAGFHVVIPF